MSDYSWAGSPYSQETPDPPAQEPSTANYGGSLSILVKAQFDIIKYQREALVAQSVMIRNLEDHIKLMRNVS